MSEKLISTSSVMEGKGAYNRYVKLPAGGAALALPLLERAIQNMKLDFDGRPVVIADYGFIARQKFARSDAVRNPQP